MTHMIEKGHLRFHVKEHSAPELLMAWRMEGKFIGSPRWYQQRANRLSMTFSKASSTLSVLRRAKPSKFSYSPRRKRYHAKLLSRCPSQVCLLSGRERAVVVAS